MAIGGVFELNINGNRCAFRIESMDDDGHNNIKIARVNRASTRIVILPSLVSVGNTALSSGMDEQIENLAQIISTWFAILYLYDACDSGQFVQSILCLFIRT